MKEHGHIPSKRDWALLGLGAALCLSTVAESPSQSPKTVDISSPTPKAIPTPHYGPFPLAKRVICRDEAAYNQKTFCPQATERHQ